METVNILNDTKSDIVGVKLPIQRQTFGQFKVMVLQRLLKKETTWVSIRAISSPFLMVVKTSDWFPRSLVVFTTKGIYNQWLVPQTMYSCKSIQSLLFLSIIRTGSPQRWTMNSTPTETGQRRYLCLNRKIKRDHLCKEWGCLKTCWGKEHLQAKNQLRGRVLFAARTHPQRNMRLKNQIINVTPFLTFLKADIVCQFRLGFEGHYQASTLVRPHLRQVAICCL